MNDLGQRGLVATFSYAVAPRLVLMRAPNRFRKLLIDGSLPKDKRDSFGLDKSFAEVSGVCIAMQRSDFPDVPGEPIGFQATWDNDIAIAWEKSVA